jgi:putative FmdB family regulatory protein
MPIYEYRCEACGGEQEVIQSVNAEPLKDCAACGEPALKKLVSAAAFHLKGTGWYVTDFRDNDKKKKGAKDEPKGEGEGGAKSETKAGKDSKDTAESKKDSKPDAPTKSKGSDSAAST